jgi:hypothetical protein
MTTIVALFFALLQATTQGTQLQVGTAVRPETTTVGQHFIATIRVRVPNGTQVIFPTRPDSAAHVDSAGPTTRTESMTGGFNESTVNYVLAAWDTGGQSLGLDSIVVIGPSGQRTAALKDFNVRVRSVLPADTSLRKPKPYRPVVAIAPFNWLPWALAAAAIALIALLIWLWRRWRRRRGRGLSPLQVAERDFARIDSQRLIESGESERYAVEMVRVLRVYLAATVPVAAQSATTHELADALQRSRVVPAQRLLDVLDATDLIKFARERSTAERAREIGGAARSIVADVNTAVEAERVAAAKESAKANAKAKAA